MIKRIVIFLCLIFFVMPVSGQDTETWFWAVNNDGALLAFTPSGEVNELLASGVEVDEAFRVSSSSVLAQLWVDDVYSLYLLTADAATLVELPDLELDRGKIFDVKGSLALLWNPTTTPIADIPVNRLALVNFETGQALDLGFAVRPWVFTESGLRYASVDEETQAITILEATAESADTILELPTDSLYTQPDQSGDYWLTVQQEGETESWLFTVFNVDGTSEVLETINMNPQAAYWTTLGNWLVRVTTTCTTQCTVSRRPVDGGDTQEFTLPNDGGFFRPQFVVDTTGDIVMWKSPENLVSLLREDGSVVPLGQYSFQSITAETGLTSPDHRYLLTLTQPPDERGYRLWDLENAQSVMENEQTLESPFIVVRYMTHGVLVFDTESNHWRVYYNGETVDLPADRNYFDVLEDGGLLYWTGVASGAPGIYLHRGDDNPTLLVPNARPLNARTYAG